MTAANDENRPRPSFFGERNSATRIDMFEELSETAEPALRQFFRRLDAAHFVDEVLLPTLKLGDARVYCAVRDRPWPPWGLGARHISAVCDAHSIAPESWAISPVYVADEDATNIGLVSAVYKEVLESIAVSKTAEVCYLVAEGSKLADHVLRDVGFRVFEDVFMTEQARYYTYRISARELLDKLGLAKTSTPALLMHEVRDDTLVKNALFHQTVLLGARAELRDVLLRPEILRLVRGGHASKPGGVPGGTGTELGTDMRLGPRDRELPAIYVALGGFLRDKREGLVQKLVQKQDAFEAATVLPRGEKKAKVDERVRKAQTLDDLSFVRDEFLERLKGTLEGAIARLGMEAFPVGEIELQVTASGDGDYYRMHTDADAESTRVLSFVYFLHSEPRRFSGGELRLFDDRLVRGDSHADSSVLISPRQDMLVLFRSDSPHELLPVRVPTKEFADSRFTINGWVHRKAKG
ncbi:MAG: 2OG-Fe(II) oxygenase [Planctomycetes bacterium]|nr:2OG-Fe(II) oxygenase [Planctomycetota bacterium]